MKSNFILDDSNVLIPKEDLQDLEKSQYYPLLFLISFTLNMILLGVIIHITH